MRGMFCIRWPDADAAIVMSCSILVASLIILLLVGKAAVDREAFSRFGFAVWTL